MTRPQLVDLVPLEVNCRGYQGDPFDWSLHLTLDDGTPADVDGWVWEAWIELPDGTVTAWQCSALPDGVELYLAGAETSRLSSTYAPFDVTGRDPQAGEGRTVARGAIACLARITPPLRGASAGVPGPHELVDA